jgi:hypothetical protein
MWIFYVGDHVNSVKIWSEVKNLFNLEPTDQSSRDKKKRKQYWSDFDVVRGAGEEGGSDSKVDVKTEASSQSQKKSKADVFTVPAALSEGSVNPVEDMDKILVILQSAKDGEASNLMDIQDVVITSLRNMGRTVELLVLTGATSAHYRKALNCLQKLREASLIDFGSSSLSVVERYNSFMKDNIKGKFKGGRHNIFWESIVSAHLSLIHEGEAIGGVSKDESKTFLEDAVVQVVEVVPEVKQEEEEEDDLFGDMA